MLVTARAMKLMLAYLKIFVMVNLILLRFGRRQDTKGMNTSASMLQVFMAFYRNGWGWRREESAALSGSLKLFT